MGHGHQWVQNGIFPTKKKSKMGGNLLSLGLWVFYN